MDGSFPRSLRALEADGFRRWAPALLFTVALVVAWTLWFLRARVTVYAVTDRARLEVSHAAHPVEAPMEGRVAAVRMTLGKEVEQGDVLVELDSEERRLRLEEERSRLKALLPQREALQNEVEGANRALLETREAARAALDEARARHEGADAEAVFAEQEAERLARMSEQGLVSGTDLARARSEAKQKSAFAEAEGRAVVRLELDLRSNEMDRRARLDRLEREFAEIQGRQETTATTITRLEDEIDEHRIRSPVSGRIGEVSDIRVGSVVQRSERLGVVVPPGDLIIVADFAVQDAVGRIRPGQPARMRLDAFPWTQYGSIAAHVVRLATEPREGRVQVELVPATDPESRIPLQHGLPGSVEVQVEKVSPATLVLRAAGKLEAGGAAAPARETRR